MYQYSIYEYLEGMKLDMVHVCEEFVVAALTYHTHVGITSTHSMKFSVTSRCTMVLRK
jgi:hypothetical protein